MSNSPERSVTGPCDGRRLGFEFSAPAPAPPQYGLPPMPVIEDYKKTDEYGRDYVRLLIASIGFVFAVGTVGSFGIGTAVVGAILTATVGVTSLRSMRSAKASAETKYQEKVDERERLNTSIHAANLRAQYDFNARDRWHPLIHPSASPGMFVFGGTTEGRQALLHQIVGTSGSQPSVLALRLGDPFPFESAISGRHASNPKLARFEYPQCLFSKLIDSPTETRIDYLTDLCVHRVDQRSDVRRVLRHVVKNLPADASLQDVSDALKILANLDLDRDTSTGPLAVFHSSSVRSRLGSDGADLALTTLETLETAVDMTAGAPGESAYPRIGGGISELLAVTGRTEGEQLAAATSLLRAVGGALELSKSLPDIVIVSGAEKLEPSQLERFLTELEAVGVLAIVFSNRLSGHVSALLRKTTYGNIFLTLSHKEDATIAENHIGQEFSWRVNSITQTDGRQQSQNFGVNRGTAFQQAGGWNTNGADSVTKSFGQNWNWSEVGTESYAKATELVEDFSVRAEQLQKLGQTAFIYDFKMAFSEPRMGDCHPAISSLPITGKIMLKQPPSLVSNVPAPPRQQQR